MTNARTSSTATSSTTSARFAPIAAKHATRTAEVMNPTPCIDSAGNESHEWEEHADVVTGDPFYMCDRCGKTVDAEEVAAWDESN